jgi:recombinational DNA repair protein RecR
MVQKCLAGLGTNDGAKEIMFHGLVKRQAKYTQLIRKLVNIKNELHIRSDL